MNTRPLLPAFVFLLPLVGCSPSQREDRPPPEALLSRVDVYLGCSDPGPRQVCVEFGSVALRSASGALVPLTPARTSFCSNELARREPLAGASTPPGDYDALVLHLASATLESGGGKVRMRLSSSAGAEPSGGADAPDGLDCTLPLQLHIGRREAAMVLVDWRATDSLAGGAEFVPAFSLRTEKPRATLGLVYVADSASGTVLAVDPAAEEVVGTFKSGPEVRALALGRDRRRLYAANAGDGSLSIIDVRLGSAETTVPIGLSARSWDVVLADDDRLVAVTNRDIDKLTLIDGNIGTRLAELSLAHMPTRMAAAPLLRRLFVIESGSDALEVIDTDARASLARIATGARPSDVALDWRGQEVYVGHTTSPNLLAIDAARLSVAATIFVGADVTAVLGDRHRDRIYVARTHPNELVVIERRLAAVVRRIPLSGRVESLAQPLEGSLIYAAAPDRGALLVIDVVLGREETAIRCGKRPTDVLVAD